MSWSAGEAGAAAAIWEGAVAGGGGAFFRPSSNHPYPAAVLAPTPLRVTALSSHSFACFKRSVAARLGDGWNPVEQDGKAKGRPGFYCREVIGNRAFVVLRALSAGRSSSRDSAGSPCPRPALGWWWVCGKEAGAAFEVQGADFLRDFCCVLRATGPSEIAPQVMGTVAEQKHRNAKQPKLFLALGLVNLPKGLHAGDTLEGTARNQRQPKAAVRGRCRRFRPRRRRDSPSCVSRASPRT